MEKVDKDFEQGKRVEEFYIMKTKTDEGKNYSKNFSGSKA